MLLEPPRCSMLRLCFQCILLSALAALAALAVLAALAALVVFAAGPAGSDEPADEFLWLEEVEGERALRWVEQRNDATRAEFAGRDEFREIYADVLAFLDAPDKLIDGTQHGEFFYNHWQDEANPRGLFRRASVSSFVAGEPAWDVLFDVDALAEAEGKSWVFKGIDLREPDYQRGLVRLSDGGSDAIVIREFDLATKLFVGFVGFVGFDGPGEGFQLPEAKGSLGWIDADSVYVATDFGPGSLTDSGYARRVKIWRRGTPLASASLLFEGRQESVGVGASRAHYGSDGAVDWVWHSTSFYESINFVRHGDALTQLEIPASALIHTVFGGELFFELKEDWSVGETIFPQGAVLTIPFRDLEAGKRNFSVFLQPSDRFSLLSLSRTRSYLIVQLMEDVRDRLFRYQRTDGRWQREELPLEGDGTLRPSSLDPNRDTFFLTYTSFLQPSMLLHVDATSLTSTLVQQAPERFDGSRFESSQRFATSKDGTRVPYFLVTRRGLVRDGKTPTLLYGYGGFRVSLRPHYLAGVGKGWLERGGAYAVANIRGGGEYGPRWHAAALEQNRPRAFEDFEAVAEDLIAEGITTPSRLGIRGGSNGGLLVGAAFTRRPELFGAVVCQMPLLDMQRFSHLLAGASWMGEYGNPDLREDWAFLRRYSPYHNLRSDQAYPRVLFTTSTRDDRVHPGHARKMVARMTAMGHPVVYFENTEGGHAGAADSKQRAFREALIYTYLLGELSPKAP